MNANHNEASVGEAITIGSSVAVTPKTGWGSRVASGAVGAGTVGVLGLLGGFWTPLAALVFLMMGRGTITPAGSAGGENSLFLYAVVLLMALLTGCLVGIAGLIVGLLVGTLAGSIGPGETAPRRMRIASGGIVLATFVTGCYLAYYGVAS